MTDNFHLFQTPWKPRLKASPTDALPEQLEARPEAVTRLSRVHLDGPADDWKATLMTVQHAAAPAVHFASAPVQLYGREDGISVDEGNDWRSMDGSARTVQPPQPQGFFVDAVTGANADRPHFEAWVHRERTTSTTTEPSATQRYNKSYRRPYSAARRTEEVKGAQTLSDNGDRSANLRSILKQTGGMSLSEILQQRNLSLDDLLNGKQTALKALQNTASPPIEPSGGGEKPMRRLPVSSQPTSRRNASNAAHRMASNPSDDIAPSGREDDSVDSGELSAEKKAVSTIPTFLADTSTATNGKYGRSPPSRKPIKEVVSAIRPDLNNSNLRKRLPNAKSMQTKAPQPSSTVEAQMNDNIAPPSEAIVPTNETMAGIESSMPSTAGVPEARPMVATAATTTDEPKPLARERVPFRPQRPRNSGLFRAWNYTEAPIVSVSLSTPVATMTNDELPAYTVISSTTPATEPHSPVVYTMQPMDGANRPLDDVSVKIIESAPELNLVDLEDESKSKEVTSLEDLFLDDPLDDSSNLADASGEFILASSTSRSDTVPNSLKIFGGNLVNIFRKTLDKLDVTERNPALFTDISSKFIDDKTEIMDLLTDRRSGARLVKVLKQRNMTIDELVDHRKRGSSQLHLAEIFFNRTKMLPTSTMAPPPPPPSPPSNQSRLDVVTAFKNFPDFNLESVKSVNPDEIKTDAQGESYFTSVINVQPTAELAKEGRAMQKPFSVKLLESATKSNIPTQLWHTDTSVDTNFLENSSPGIASQHSLRPSTGDDANANGFHEIIDQNRNDAAARYRDPLDLELTGQGYRRNSVLIENAQQAPMGVRSAIVASASIVLISLTIFIVIFLVCRWRQKRKRKICYTDRFQAIRGRLPILGSRDASPSKHSSSPPMAYIGGANNSRRSSKLNTMDPNSPEVQEYLYDAMRKPFQ